MNHYLLILISTILVNNFVLVQFLGLYPFINASNKLKSGIGISLATIFVLTLSSLFNYLAYSWLLRPLGLEFLQTITFILVIAVVAQLTEILVKKINFQLYKILGIFFPLVTINSAVLGVSLININKNHGLIESIFYGFGAATGFSMVLILFSAMRERIAFADVPAPFKGSAIGLITAGLMSLAFLGFTGLTSV